MLYHTKLMCTMWTVNVQLCREKGSPLGLPLQAPSLGLGFYFLFGLRYCSNLLADVLDVDFVYANLLFNWGA